MGWILEFRTAVNSSGKCKYLGVDLENKCYSFWTRYPITNDITLVRVKDLDYIVSVLKSNDFRQASYVN